MCVREIEAIKKVIHFHFCTDWKRNDTAGRRRPEKEEDKK